MLRGVREHHILIPWLYLRPEKETSSLLTQVAPAFEASLGVSKPVGACGLGSVRGGKDASLLLCVEVILICALSDRVCDSGEPIRVRPFREKTDQPRSRHHVNI